MTGSLTGVQLHPGRPPVLDAGPAGDAAGWVERHGEGLRDLVDDHGAVVVRGLGLRTVADVSGVAARLGSGCYVEREAFAARTVLSDGVYSATPWPSRQLMCAHHELSYVLEIPATLMFACLHAPGSGGTTPLVDTARVVEELPADLVERVERQGWILTRSYGDDIGASWEQAFGTADRSEVDWYCRSNGIATEWLTDGGLRTRQRRYGVLIHPVTGERVWFNQIAFLSEYAMDPEVREFLLEMHGPEGLPFTTRFGDGSPIPQDVIDQINAAHDRHAVCEPWQDGDLLVVDNLRVAHGREPYTGEREIVVAMTDGVSVPAFDEEA
ncbi:Taurine dioxygenase, alpha-ketoglutarate-dependent [Pseudonocardia ammonioxydans]|uniref:Taurine dioxygenase, alpha-ketoglutarate-dependent n=1 Tax=Pseudonocardia ammonioxydans TaxID=260086 RepID=A0A1I5DYH2_PSUAM|nr:TauD/TfdA family dioxygenase [Pseudonocardia ammonioxydans]SFO04242.1 Taurine dioxygenase, alpha-ketoglutarate-dependent [Pseudonocardia ammonioxydans]